MTSIPASRSALATIFAPRSWPSRPGLAMTTRIGPAMLASHRRCATFRRALTSSAAYFAGTDGRQRGAGRTGVSSQGQPGGRTPLGLAAEAGTYAVQAEMVGHVGMPAPAPDGWAQSGSAGGALRTPPPHDEALSCQQFCSPVRSHQKSRPLGAVVPAGLIPIRLPIQRLPRAYPSWLAPDRQLS